jgi:hypothetical protein
VEDAPPAYADGPPSPGASWPSARDRSRRIGLGRGYAAEGGPKGETRAANSFGSAVANCPLAIT